MQDMPYVQTLPAHECKNRSSVQLILQRDRYNECSLVMNTANLHTINFDMPADTGGTVVRAHVQDLWFPRTQPVKNQKHLGFGASLARQWTWRLGQTGKGGAVSRLLITLSACSAGSGSGKRSRTLASLKESDETSKKRGENGTIIVPRDDRRVQNSCKVVRLDQRIHISDATLALLLVLDSPIFPAACWFKQTVRAFTAHRLLRLWSAPVLMSW